MCENADTGDQDRTQKTNDDDFQMRSPVTGMHRVVHDAFCSSYAGRQQNLTQATPGGRRPCQPKGPFAYNNSGIVLKLNVTELEEWNQERQEEAASAGQPFLPFRIGIDTGRCVVGNLGSDLRFNYSVLGDPVNVASRLEGQTKYYGVPVILGSRTGEKAKEKFAILELDLLAVKGKTEPETIYALLGPEEIAGDVCFQELRKLYSTMLYRYRSRDWEGTLEAIDLCRPAENNFGLTELFRLYRTRIEPFRESAPPPDWTEVFVAETK